MLIPTPGHPGRRARPRPLSVHVLTCSPIEPAAGRPAALQLPLVGSGRRPVVHLADSDHACTRFTVATDFASAQQEQRRRRPAPPWTADTSSRPTARASCRIERCTDSDACAALFVVEHGVPVRAIDAPPHPRERPHAQGLHLPTYRAYCSWSTSRSGSRPRSLLAQHRPQRHAARGTTLGVSLEPVLTTAPPPAHTEPRRPTPRVTASRSAHQGGSSSAPRSHPPAPTAPHPVARISPVPRPDFSPGFPTPWRAERSGLRVHHAEAGGWRRSSFRPSATSSFAAHSRRSGSR